MYKVLLQCTKWYLQVELDEAILLDCSCDFASMHADFDALPSKPQKKSVKCIDVNSGCCHLFQSISLWLCEFVVRGVSFACVDIRRFKWKLITL